MSDRCLYPVVVAGLLLALAPSTASADEPRRVGVVVTVRVNISTDEARALSTDLGEVLREERPVDIIAGVEVERRMPADGIPDDCVAEPDCRTDIGRRLDADELLMLVVVKLGDRIQIDPTWADVASGKVTSRPQIALTPGDDRLEVLRASVPKLLPHIEKPKKGNGNNIIIVPPNGGDKHTGGRDITAPTWIAGGVAAAALLGGTVFAVSSNRKFSTLDDDGCRQMLCDPDDIRSLRNHALAADILFGVAAASTVTAVILYLRTPSTQAAETPPEEAGGLSVGLGPAPIGLSLGGSF